MGSYYLSVIMKVTPSRDWSAMPVITPDTPIRDVLVQNEKVLDVLALHGLGCAACIGAQFETIRDACAAHDIDVKKLTDDLTAALAASE